MITLHTFAKKRRLHEGGFVLNLHSLSMFLKRFGQRLFATLEFSADSATVYYSIIRKNRARSFIRNYPFSSFDVLSIVVEEFVLFSA